MTTYNISELKTKILTDIEYTILRNHDKHTVDQGMDILVMISEIQNKYHDEYTQNRETSRLKANNTQYDLDNIEVENKINQLEENSHDL